jgi:hypothetical protein
MSITKLPIARKALHFIMLMLKWEIIVQKCNLYSTSETDSAVWSGVLGPYREGLIGALNWVQKREAEFSNNIKESLWKTLTQCRLRARICAFLQGIYRGTVLESDTELMCKIKLPY